MHRSKVSVAGAGIFALGSVGWKLEGYFLGFERHCQSWSRWGRKVGGQCADGEGKNFSVTQFRDEVTNQIWNKVAAEGFRCNIWVPKKVIFFIWKLVQGCIAEKIALLQRGISIMLMRVLPIEERLGTLEVMGSKASQLILEILHPVRKQVSHPMFFQNPTYSLHLYFPSSPSSILV
ncbi:hypothetical protein HanRHA438_Chr01g0000621 [Helianthus annuus]|nr:hypothetical protein HanRHA438_Chr01g0000621 [Helianthus annuus]